MVNNMWSWTSNTTPYNPDVPVIVQEWIDRRRAEQRALANEAWVWDLFDQEMKQPLWISDIMDENTQNLRNAQQEADAKRILELQQIIANWEWWNLWKIARIWLWMTAVPDSIDEIWPRFEYSKEDAQKYLDELNKKYPIKQVLWKYFDEIVRWDKSLFNMSAIWRAEFETKMKSYIVASARAWKWIESKFSYWNLSLEELVRYASEENGNPFNIIKEHDLQWFYKEPIKRRFVEWLTKQPVEFQMYTFPKEHLIQDLMIRLWTSVWSDLQIEQK